MNAALHCPYAKGGACVRQAEHSDPCEVFECAGCHQSKPACAGGDADDHDATGELCTDCWFKRTRSASPAAAEPSAVLNRCIIGDCRQTLAGLPAETFACCVTSPPYWGLRDYGHPEQIGLEATPEAYVQQMVDVFRQVRRVLRHDGTLWLNLGDVYSSTQSGGQGKNGNVYGRAAARAGVRKGVDKRVPGLKPKDLCGMPWRVAFALQADGWYLRSEIIWHKLNPMPESVLDRPTRAHEYVFLLSKSAQYYYDGNAIREQLAAKTRTTFGTKPQARCHDPFVKSSNWAKSIEERKPRLNADGSESGANARSVWPLPSQPYDGAHFATMPPKLAERCVLAGSPLGGAVLDPFFGSGTVGQVAEQLGRRWLGCELNPKYAELAAERTAQSGLQFAGEGR